MAVEAETGAVSEGPPANPTEQVPDQEVPEELLHLRRLRRIVRGNGVAATAADPSASSPGDIEAASLTELPRLYRFASTLLARLEASGEHPRLLRETRELLADAHALLYRDRRHAERSWPERAARFLFEECPRTIREEWRLLALSFCLLYGLAAISFFAVRADLDLAPSLLSPAVVEQEIEQLEATADGEPYRGNFTFGLSESPTTAGWIMLHNMGVGVLFFTCALIPPLYLYLLSTNALMLGTYTAVAGHWGQAGAISSLLWCHGTLEIQAILLAGTAGLLLTRAMVRPGPRTRRYALAKESARSLRVLVPVFPMLFFAGIIEAFVTPHTSFEVRMGCALVTGGLLLAWGLLGGRSSSSSGGELVGEAV